MSRGERQKPTTDAYRDNYDRVFGGGSSDEPVRKGKKAKPTQPHKDRTKYDRKLPWDDQ